MEDTEMERFTRIAILLSIIIATMLAAVLLYFGRPEPYSSVFIVPDTYQNYIGNSSSILFTWGIQSFEQGPSKYKVNFLLGDLMLNQRELNLDSGQYQMNESFELPSNTSFPQKVRIKLYVADRSYEAYYWLRGRD